ncbi:MAG: HEAT repeat domain-containing protein [Polyangiales bacterium]
MSRRAPRVAAIALAALSTAGDWPGAGQELAAEFRDAAPARRVAIVAAIATLGADECAPTLRAALQDPSEAVVLEALEAVTRHRLRPLFRDVAARLGDERASVRLGAVNASRVLRAREGLPGLLRAAGDSDVSVRVAAVGAVATLGVTGAAAALVDRVHDPESAVRIAALRALGEIGDASAALTVLGVLEDPNPDVRVAAAQALGHIADARAIEALRGALRDDVVTVRLAALRALSGLGDAADAATDDIAPMVFRATPRVELGAREALTRAALETLCALDTPRATALLARAIREGREADVNRAAQLLYSAPAPRRARLMDALGPLPSPSDAQLLLIGVLGGARAADVLLASLRGAIAGQVPRILTALGESGDPRAPQVLLRYAGDVGGGAAPDERTARCALSGVQASALAGLRGYVTRAGSLPRPAVDPLLAWLARQPAHCRAEINDLLELLGATENPRAAQALLAWTRSDDSTRRAVALRALGRTGGVAAAELLPQLRDPDATVRLAVAEVLAHHLDAEGMAALRQQLHEDSRLDRGTAVRVLAAAAIRLGRADELAAPLAALVDAGGRGAPTLRESVWDALGQLAAAGSDTAVSALRRAPASEIRTVSAAWGDALAAASPARGATLAAVVPPLSPDPVEAAWQARGRADAADTLLRALGSAQTELATNAAAALALRAARALPMPDAGALCAAWFEAVDRGVRGNLGAALVRADAPCAAEVLRDAERPDEEHVVRLAIATAASERAAEPLRAALLRRCAVGDPTNEVFFACARMLAAGPPSRGDLDVQVRDGDEVAGRDSRVQIQLADGLVVWTRPGAEGWVRLRGVARGEFRVSR